MKTKKERREVYLLAAVKLFYKKHRAFCCTAISQVLFNRENEEFTCKAEYMSKELQLFKPDNTDYLIYGWWGYDDIITRNTRIIALLLCAEMCR